MTDSRRLSDSTSLSGVLENWAKSKGILDTNGNPASVYPTIIGMPSGSTTLGAFNLSVIDDNRTIKQALQDVENALDTRLVKSSNLADLPNKATARTNLELGSAAVWNVGTSGAVVPLLNGNNTWTGVQTFGQVKTSNSQIITSNAGVSINVTFATGNNARWAVGKDATAETGSAAGSNFIIGRYNDAGAYVDAPFQIARSDGSVILTRALGVAYGGTGVTSLPALKSALGLDQVSNTTDASKPISTAVQNALNDKLSVSTGGTVSGAINSTQSMISTTFTRAGTYLIADGASAQGGQIILGYRNVSTLSGPANGTWRFNVDGSNLLNLQNTKADGTSVTTMQISENGVAIFSQPIDGRAYPRMVGGASLNMNWNGQGGQPTWLWGANDTNNTYLYNPSNFSVANSAQLSGIAGGNGGGYVRRSGDVTTNGYASRQLALAGGAPDDNVWSAPLELREVNGGGSANTASSLAPGLLFHWNGVTAAALKMQADGSFRFQGQSSSITYRNVWAASYYTSDWFRPLGSTGIYWDSVNRGLTNADNGASYGSVNVVGAGLNGYLGYSVGNWITVMSNGTDSGLYSQQAGNWLLRFDSAQNAYFPANVTAFSDERLKQNMRPIDNVTLRREGMAKAAIVYERDGETRIGFGAQTLELAVPEVVKTADDLTGTKSVNYADMVAILAADNQQLADRIATLEATIAYLINRSN